LEDEGLPRVIYLHHWQGEREGGRERGGGGGGALVVQLQGYCILLFEIPS